MSKELDLSFMANTPTSETPWCPNSPSDNLGFSASSPVSASCSVMDTPVRRVKMCEGLDVSSDSLLSNRCTSEFSRKLDKNGDEFWAALRSHYNYLMDDGLIETCKEASGELSWDDEDLDDHITWSFTEFIEQFDKLSEWLDSLHMTVSEESSSNVSRSEDIKSKICQRTVFNDQSKKLCKRYPNMKDEIMNRVVVLNNKWDTLEQVMIPSDEITDHDGLLKDVISKVKCLRRWLHLLENKIPPLTLHPGRTLSCIEEKLSENEVLQKEVESYSKFIFSVLKSFDKLCSPEQDSKVKCRCRHVEKVANNLEKRWHSIWLKSLEWRCLLEELIRKCKAGCLPSECDLDLSFGLDEPLTKVPRLGCSTADVDGSGLNYMLQQNLDDSELDMSINSFSSSTVNGAASSFADDFYGGIETAENPVSGTNFTHRGVMVGKTSISKLKEACANNSGQIGKMEIVQDVGYSSESSTYLSNDAADLAYSYDPAKRNKLKSSMHLQLKAKAESAGESDIEPVTAKLAKSSSTEFYTMTSIVLEDTEDTFMTSNGMIDSGICPNAMSEEESNSHSNNDKSKSKCGQNQICAPKDEGNSGAVKTKGHKNERVKEWLKHQLKDGKLVYPIMVDSSCDASGEYTSNDDADSSESSEDLTGSVVTCKQRSGSVESSMNERASSVGVQVGENHSPGKSDVIMRKKKRRNRDRPWSVTELYQMSNRLDLSPFSISETALNDMSAPSASTPKTEKQVSPPGLRKNLSSTLLDKPTSSTGDGAVRKKSRSRRKKTDSGSDGISSFNSTLGSSQLSGSDSTTRFSPSRYHKASRSSKSGSKSSSAEKILMDSFVGLSKSDSDSEVMNDTKGPDQILQAKDNIMQTEEISNFSDQVWDGYQDPPYWSEPYSDFGVDDNVVKKLTEFGDDYRAFIGSQSDSMSLLSCQSGGVDKTNQRIRELPPIQSKNLDFNGDSDSDMEDLHHVIKESINQLNFSENLLKEHQNRLAMGMSQASIDYAELEATCQTNVKCLQVIKNQLEDSNLSDSELYSFQGIIQRWERFNADALQYQTQHQHVLKISKDIDDVNSRLQSVLASFEIPSIHRYEQLLKWINRHQDSLSELQDIKTALFDVNSSVQKMHGGSDGGVTVHHLKKEIASLYNDWEDIYERGGNQLTELQRTRKSWQDFLNQFDKLKSRLPNLINPSSDKKLSSSVMEIKEELSWLRRHVSQESLSDCDSGIGLWDGACDLLQDVEREIDRLVDGSNGHHQHDDQHEEQNEQPSVAAATSTPNRPVRNITRSQSSRSIKSMMWRAMKGAVPFQVAIMLLCCLAWLLEPHCCEQSNSYLTSFSPHLDYSHGPPPV